MRITLKNIAKVKTADIDIKGITVIAGDNNTGKSTIGKALFSIFNGLNNIEQKLYMDKFQSLENIIDSFCTNSFSSPFIDQKNKNLIIHDIDTNILIKELLKVNTINRNNELEIESVLNKYLSSEVRKAKGLNEWSELIKKVQEILLVNMEDYIKHILSNELFNEFNGQTINIFEALEGIISVSISNQKVVVKIDSDNTIFIKSLPKSQINVNLAYIDNPFILDDVLNGLFVDHSIYTNHRRNTLEKLVISKSINNIDSIVSNSKFQKVMDLINGIVPGNLDFANSTLFYVYNKKRLNAKNLSTGIKTFAILKKLLLSGGISNNGVIILDEPEIHLHPEWQLILAELIVLLQKEFNLHILITTHSPYFLNAIEVYVAKHNINDKCKYYLSKCIENSESVTFDDVSNEIDLIYKKLVKPLQKLENLRYRL